MSVSRPSSLAWQKGVLPTPAVVSKLMTLGLDELREEMQALLKIEDP